MNRFLDSDYYVAVPWQAVSSKADPVSSPEHRMRIAEIVGIIATAATSWDSRKISHVPVLE
jgi:hypothetical protein